MRGLCAHVKGSGDRARAGVRVWEVGVAGWSGVLCSSSAQHAHVLPLLQLAHVLRARARAPATWHRAVDPQFLAAFRLPGESQKIARIVEHFAEHYFEQHKEAGPLANADTAYILSYAIIMLNTDLHNAQVRGGRGQLTRPWLARPCACGAHTSSRAGVRALLACCWCRPRRALVLQCSRACSRPGTVCCISSWHTFAARRLFPLERMSRGT